MVKPVGDVGGEEAVALVPNTKSKFSDWQFSAKPLLGSKEFPEAVVLRGNTIS